MLDRDRQCFCPVQHRGRHVAQPVAELKPRLVLLRGGHVNAAVVDLDLLVGLEIVPYAKAAAVPMDPKLQDALAAGIARTGSNLVGRRLPSGAGHDAMAIAAAAPVAMLFVRNEKGISHSPLENMSEADAGIAIRVLLETILELAGRSK